MNSAKNRELIFTQTREEFLDSKKRTFGGTETKIITGNSKYKSPYVLYLERVSGIIPDVDNKFTRAGHMLEEAIIKRFYQERGKEYNKPDLITVAQHPAYDFINVHPDDIFEENEKRFLLEIKTTQFYLTEKNVDEFCDKEYFTQWNFTLGVLKTIDSSFDDLGYLIVLSRGVDYFVVKFRYDEKKFLNDLNEVVEFKIKVECQIEPELTPLDLDIKYKLSDNSSQIAADKVMLEKHNTLLTLSETIDLLEKERENVKAEIKAYMKNAAFLIDSEGNVLVSWKSTLKSRPFIVKTVRNGIPSSVQLENWI